ncbi:FecR domain-containing protein [Achromobacter aloeverae]
MAERPAPPAAGQHRRIVAEAAEWLVRLEAGADAGTLDAWRRWHDADAEHAAVWRRYADLQRMLPAPPRGASPCDLPPAAQALKAVASRRGRRQAIKLLCGGAAALTAGGMAWRQADSQGWLAQTRTAVGEQRPLTLADGTRLLLNTRTAIDIHEGRADADTARIEVVLHAGEMLVDNRDDGGAGLRLRTRHGYVEPYSAQLLLRQLPECSPSETMAALREGTARLVAGGHVEAALQAGQARRFDDAGFQPPQAWRERDLAWTQGVLIADDLRLDDLLRQLARYRHGFLECDDAVAARRVTGTFRIHDTDRVLEALAHHLGLRLRYRTRYWVTLQS